jgi:hypothetical protein
MIEKQSICAKLDPHTVERIDELADRFYPWCEGRSTVIRTLLHLVFALEAAGTIKLDLPGIQKVLDTRYARKLKKQ